MIKRLVIVCAIAVALFGAFHSTVHENDVHVSSQALADYYCGAGSCVNLNTSQAACTDLGSGLCINAGLLQIANPVLNTITSSAASPLSLTATTATVSTVGAVNTTALIINASTVSGTGKLVDIQSGGATQWNVSSAGTVTQQGGLTASAGNISAANAGTGKGEFISGAGSVIAAALGAGSIVIGTTGLIANDVSCSLTFANNGASQTMTNGTSCKATTGAANTATGFIFAYANSYNTAPQVYVQNVSCASAGITLIPSVTMTALTGFTVNWELPTTGAATACGNAQVFNVHVEGGK